MEPSPERLVEALGLKLAEAGVDIVTPLVLGWWVAAAGAANGRGTRRVTFWRPLEARRDALRPTGSAIGARERQGNTPDRRVQHPQGWRRPPPPTTDESPPLPRRLRTASPLSLVPTRPRACCPHRYNESIPAELGARIPARAPAGQGALAVLVANSRAVWEPFVEACAARGLLQHDNPLEAYLEEAVCGALAAAAPG